MVHVGVDLDKHSSQIALLTKDGEIAQQRLPNDADVLTKFFGRLPPQTPIAIEASGTWWWLIDLLEQLGHQPVLSHPKQTKAIAAARLKNDRVDAERLALLLRGDLLPTVWIPPAALREARELIRHRVSLVWLRGEVRNRLLALLARRNLQPTSGKGWLTQRGQRELHALPLTPIAATIREDCRALLPLAPDHRVGTLAERFGCARPGAHHADVDVEMLGGLVVGLEQELHSSTTGSAVYDLLRRAGDAWSGVLAPPPRPALAADIIARFGANITPLLPEQPALAPAAPNLTAVDRAFAQAEQLGHTRREPQIELAHIVASTFASGGYATIEAGTGTGKSLGYLLPAALHAVAALAAACAAARGSITWLSSTARRAGACSSASKLATSSALRLSRPAT